MKGFLMTFCYNHKSVPSPNIHQIVPPATDGHRQTLSGVQGTVE